MIEWQRDFFDFGHVSEDVRKLIESGDLQRRHAEADRAQRGRRETARLLPARRGTGSHLVAPGQAVAWGRV